MSVPLLEGDSGTEQTIKLIRRAVAESLGNACVRATAAEALRSVPSFNDRAAVQALFTWVQQNVRFTNDPVGHETISSAEWTIRNGIGDCDDINGVLLPSLLMMVGYPVRLVTINDDPTNPHGEFTHIYCEVLLQSGWLPMDAARPGAQLGTSVSRTFRKRIWPIDTGGFTDLQGQYLRRGLAGASLAVSSGPPRVFNGRRSPTLRSGLGDDSSVFQDILDSINVGANAASKIVTSLDTPSFSYAPSAAAPYGVNPSTGIPYPAPTTTALGSINPTYLLLGGLAIVLIAGKK